MKEYALYKGDEVLVIGTIGRMARELGVKPSTIIYYGTPTYRKRTSENARRLVKIEDE